MNAPLLSIEGLDVRFAADGGERAPNAVAEKNARGAEGRERMHRPLGNAFFARFDRD